MIIGPEALGYLSLGGAERLWNARSLQIKLQASCIGLVIIREG